MKLLVVKPSPFHILISLEPKYWPQDPAFKYLHYSLTVRNHVLQQNNINNRDYLFHVHFY